MKEKEKILRSKEEGKYFRSKINSPVLYGQIIAAIRPYLTPEKLRMLMHQWSTQINEIMNNSIAVYVPKTKNFSGTLSLRIRVGISTGTLALG